MGGGEGFEFFPQQLVLTLNYAFKNDIHFNFSRCDIYKQPTVLAVIDPFTCYGFFFKGL